MTPKAKGRHRRQHLLRGRACSAHGFLHGVGNADPASAGDEKYPPGPEAPAPQSLPPAQSPGHEDPHSEQGKEPHPPEKFWRRHPRLVQIGFLVLFLALAGGALYWDYARRFESTDDAFIAARQFAIAPQVGGYVTHVPVTDNQHVAAGAVIARIDQRTYRAQLAQAEAQVAGAGASIETIGAQINAQQAQIAASEAQLLQSRAALVFAQEQATRYGVLASDGASTVEIQQQYTSQLRQQQAAVRQAQANLRSVQTQLRVLGAQRANAIASLEQARAQREQARLNLAYTTVTTAQPGHVVQLSAAVGQFAQTGASLTMFVPDEIWVVANFKETQLNRMRPGQTARITIDAYPGRTFRGRVASIQPGSGTALSLLPAQQATGNYVKIVQRVPVKIVIENPPADIALGPGMSVVPTVRVGP